MLAPERGIAVPQVFQLVAFMEYALQFSAFRIDGDFQELIFNRDHAGSF